MELDNPSYFSMLRESSEGPFARTSKSASISSCPENSLGKSSKGKCKVIPRSFSSNSQEANDLFIRGQPRLRDMAPEIIVKHAALLNLPKRMDTNEVICTELPLLPQMMSSDEGENSGDEVFLNEESARYYNSNAFRNPQPRRHSISTFSTRERTTSVSSSLKSFKEDFREEIESPGGGELSTINGTALSTINGTATQHDDHSLRHASYPRKRCVQCTKGTNLNSANMDDILIVSLKCSTTANLWVDYFSSYFQQVSKQANRKPFKIHHLATEDFLEAHIDTNLILEKSALVKLQIVVLCPGFLEYLSRFETNTNFGKLFLPDRTLALLLGVSDNDLNEVHKKALPTYSKWQRMTVGHDQDETFCKDFVTQAMAILSRIWKQQSTLAVQEKSCFSVSPKKIRHGQNGLFIILNYPLQKEDCVKISIEKDNVIREITNVKRKNPYTIKISVPDCYTECSYLINVLVEKNGSIIGSRPVKCESKFRELEQILRSCNQPIEFMCQTLGFTPADREHLDNWLVNNFHKNVPPHMTLLGHHSTPFAAAMHAHKHSNEQYPTLLHFAAKFGLEKLAMQLLDCPGADIAYEIKNVHDMTPPEIAESNGFSELACALRGFMNMNEFSNIYSKLKAISMNPPEDIDDNGYLIPRCAQEDFYKICPAPRPLTLNIQSQSPTPSTSQEVTTPIGYMSMHTPIKEDIYIENMSASQPLLTAPSFSPKKHFDNFVIVPNNRNQKHLDQYDDKVQKELAEIISDFKNNIHSISQVEKLVEEWKNRNDVQKSYEQKQQQLREMRLRYEKIQMDLKSSLKKPSPFDRIKGFFGLTKPERQDSTEISDPTAMSSSSSCSSAVTPTNLCQRPISSLSTSSCGSSGRMSTASGCSLGDSGTHSDTEERKHIFRLHNEDVFRNELNKVVMELKYTPVPPPKPLKSNQLQRLITTIEEQPVNSTFNDKPNTDQYYIQFPPSGLPVLSAIPSENKKSVVHAQVHSPTNDYINVRGNSSPCISFNKEKERKESEAILTMCHEYMNCQGKTNTN